MRKYLTIIALLGSITACAQKNDSLTNTSFAANALHTGVYTTKSYSAFGSLKWKFATKGKIFSSPAVAGGMVYIGSEDHNLYAVDLQSGKQVWKFTTGGAVSSSPAVQGNTICFGSYDGYYYMLNAKTGKLNWKFKTGGERKVGAKGLWTMKPLNKYMDDLYDFFLSSPVFDDDAKNPTVYFGSSDSKFYALDAGTGKLKWVFKTNGIIHTSPALYNGKVYFGSWDTYLYALNANDGKLVWKFKTADHPVYHLLEGVQASPACSNGMVYFGSRDSYFYALNAENGTLAWKYNANNSWILTTAAIQNNTVYFGTSDTYLFVAADALTGKPKFSYKGNGYLYSSPALSASTAFFGDFTGKLFAVDLASGKPTGVFKTTGRNLNAATILKQDTLNFDHAAKGADNSLYQTGIEVMDKLYTLGSIVSSPVIAGDVIYFGSADGSLYAINLVK
ncbi:PQQ-binding-like beta-propeller repeat protein [Mucilaginibacter angelicae]|uniref:PQQ-binding-like beta-propeller repeat protein n=1 Tax=Mucilaginibacter angelicae TaxID=869718 RepID=A0ABV6L6E0_9SPHI